MKYRLKSICIDEELRKKLDSCKEFSKTKEIILRDIRRNFLLELGKEKLKFNHQFFRIAFNLHI